MTRRESAPDGAVLVAIDIAKTRNEVLIEPPGGGGRRRRLTVLNARADHDRLIEMLKSYGAPVVAGFEATGEYHRALAWRLGEAGFTVHLISSVALARTREELHNGWDKNDPKDAQVILHMPRIGVSQRFYDPLGQGINDLQEPSKTHNAISRMKTETLHRILTHYLPLYFPEIERFRLNSRCDWFFAFLERFPTPTSITTLEKDAYIAAAWEVVGRKVSKARLLGDIYETARSTIALPAPLDSPAIDMFRLILAEMRSLIRQRDQIEALAERLSADRPDYRRASNLCRAASSPLTILAEAADLRRFGHHRQFLKFCGLDLATYQSGKFRGQTELPKYGNARCGVRFGWLAKSPSARKRTASETSSSATSPATAPTRTCNARRSQPSPPRWHAWCTPSLKAGQSTAPSSEAAGPSGRTPLSSAVRAQSRPCRQCSGLPPE